MQSVQGIMGRIQEIQERASSSPLPGRFQALLDSRLAVTRPSAGAGTTAEAGPLSGSTHDLAGALRSMSTTTLGAMVGSGGLGGAGLPTSLASPMSDVSAYLHLQGIEARNGRLTDAELVPVGGGWNGRTARLLPPAAASWESMRSAAAAQGVELYAIDTYRSWEVQDRAHQAHLSGEKAANVLPAGHSQHGYGLAVDLTNGSLVGPGDVEWRWMQEFGPSFGWHPISNESWHWEFRGLP